MLLKSIQEKNWGKIKLFGKKMDMYALGKSLFEILIKEDHLKRKTEEISKIIKIKIGCNDRAAELLAKMMSSKTKDLYEVDLDDLYSALEFSS